MRNIFIGVLLALLFCNAAAPQSAAALPDPADIRGTYAISGTLSFNECVGGGEPYTVPMSLFFVVTAQTGASFTGYLGFPEDGFILYDVSGEVAADGSFTGTWGFHDDPVSDELLFERSASGKVVDGRAEVSLHGKYGDPPAIVCTIDFVFGPQSLVLQWSEPDVKQNRENPPPRALTIAGVGSAQAPTLPKQTGEDPSGYNVYRSSTPGVQPAPENLYASVPPNQTSVPAPIGLTGSFFVVTATYPTGESDPSNEVSGGVAAATLRTVKVSGTKIKAVGEDFSGSVRVFVDGIPFAAPAKVKGGAKVIQKGQLLTGQTLSQYVTSGKTVAITFRNENGGVATFVFTKP